jgi:hypothetical protein
MNRLARAPREHGVRLSLVQTPSPLTAAAQDVAGVLLKNPLSLGDPKTGNLLAE